MLKEKPMSRDAAIAEVIRRATVDRAFRDWLLKEPNSALADVLGRPVPSQIRIRCIEKDPDVDALIVLPHFRGDLEQATSSGPSTSRSRNSPSRRAAG
ncbi:MAG: hypothetical protein ACREMA_09395 [Longimicrobiales bacterium]